MMSHEETKKLVLTETEPTASPAPISQEPVSSADNTLQGGSESSAYEGVNLPEGFWAESPAYEAFKKLSAELKLSPEQFQHLVDFETTQARKQQEEATEEKRQILARWAEETKTLYGCALEQELRFALRAADSFGGPELRTLLEETGLGNHPVIIRTLSQIGRAISEDVCPGGNPSAPEDKTFAEALYGKN